jgi:hypothetical protein
MIRNTIRISYVLLLLALIACTHTNNVDAGNREKATKHYENCIENVRKQVEQHPETDTIQEIAKCRQSAVEKGMM